MFDARHAPEERGKTCRAVAIPREPYFAHCLEVVGAQGIALRPLLVPLAHALLLLPLGQMHARSFNSSAPLLLAVLQNSETVRILILAQRAVYVESLAPRVVGATLRCIRLPSPFLLRTALPPIASAEGRRVTAVHGRFGQPCPVCAAPVQRIVHADHETNYCARCQTGGKLLADRCPNC